MKANHLLRTVGLVLGAVLALAPFAAAQEDVVPVETPEAPAPEARETHFLLEYEYAYARTVGTDLRIGTLYDPGTGSFQTLNLPEESDKADTLRLGWVLPGDLGQLVGSYRSFSATSTSVVSRPGDFVLGITETLPYAHGIADDGFADAIDAAANFTSREVELNWRFPVVERPRFRMDFSIGVRTLDYKTDETISYHALDAGIPPLIEPGGGDLGYLSPLPDRMNSASEFRGRGVQAGLQSIVPIIGDRLQFEAGATLGLLRGTARSRYASTTAYYVFDDGIDQFPLTFEEFLALASQGITGNLDQTTVSIALQNPGRSTMNPSLEVSVGLRSRIWKGLELAVGGRMSYVQDVVHELRPKTLGLSPVGFPSFTGYDEQWRDASYETVYGSIGYRF